MRASSLLVVFSLFACPAVAGTIPRQEIGDLARVLVENRETAGLVVGVLSGDDQSVNGFGEVTKGGGQTPDGDTVYEIGSITKVFTGILLADAVSRGLVALDDPVVKHLPDGVLLTDEENGRKISLVQLTTHTSGLPRMPSVFEMKNPRNPYAHYGRADLLAGLPEELLESTPGEKYAYSNLGAGLLGDVLCQIQEIDAYDELLRTRLCTPLGLGDTRVELTPGMRKRLAPGYVGRFVDQPNWDFDALAGCGAIRSTVNDMLKFARANIHPEKTPLAAALRAAQIRHHSMGKEQEDRPRPGVALGWHIAGFDGRTLWHNGQTGGYHSFLAVNLESECAVVILTNSTSQQVDRTGLQILELLRASAGKDG